MLTVYCTPRYEGLMAGISPFAYKLHTWLRMAGIPYEEIELPVMQALEEAPRNMIPYVDLDDERIGDSSLIIDRLKEIHNDPLNDDRLTRSQHVHGGLIKSLCESEMPWLITTDRWIDGDYKTFGNFFFSNVPDEHRDAAIAGFNEVAVSRMHAVRMGRYDLEYICNLARTNFGMLSHALGHGPYLFGESPSTYDATVFGFVASFVHFPLANPQVKIAREFTNLIEYCDRIRDAYYD